MRQKLIKDAPKTIDDIGAIGKRTDKNFKNQSLIVGDLAEKRIWRILGTESLRIVKVP